MVWTDSSADRLLDGLNERQIAAVTAVGGPVVVHAGAGSGKTRVLTRRIVHRIATGQTDPSYVLALTFTRKAANELQQRLRRLGLRDSVVAGTFHGVALTQLRRRWEERNIDPPTMLDRKYAMVAQLVGRRRGVEILDVMAEMEWARARLVAPEFYHEAAEKAGRRCPLPADDFAELMERFQMEKRRRRVVDFDDLLAFAARDLQRDPEYAKAVRWRHRHISVDEFQDVNPLQFELLRQWRGDSSDLFVVGDPNQAIYGWNGADPFLLQDFPKREPQAQVIKLVQNYRSTPQVLTMASAALSGKGDRLVPHKADGPVPTLTAYATDTEEAEGIAARVRECRSGASGWSDQAVLVRTNAQLVVIEQALVAAGIPVRMRGGSGPLATPEVKDALRGLGRSGNRLVEALSEFDAELDAEAAEVDLDHPPTPQELERRANLGVLSRLVHEYFTVDASPTGPGLMAWIATIQAGEVHKDADAVDLSTFHGAKGLEWASVHVAGLEQGFVPISYAETGAQLAEERRLLYVAVTRAERELHLSWAAERTFGTRARKRHPSPYVEMLQQAITHLRHGHRPVDWKPQITAARSSLKSINSGDTGPQAHDPLFEALREWRRTRAKAADVPAYVIFDDKTLRAVAAKRPTSKSQLAGVSGIGPVKLERFGDEVLKIVADQTVVT